MQNLAIIYFSYKKRPLLLYSAGDTLAWSLGKPGMFYIRGECLLSPGSGRPPGERKWQPTPVFLPGDSHGWRSLVGYSLWVCKESDTTEWLHFKVSLVAQTVKRLPAMWETQVRFLGQEDPLEKEMAIHSNILAWRIPWTEEPGGLQSIGSQRVRHDWVTFTSSYMQNHVSKSHNTWT